MSPVQDTAVLPPRTLERDHALLDQLVDLDDQCIVEEAQVMRKKDVLLGPPALPQRSALRSSKFLDNLRLNSIKSASHSIGSAHEVYLSSEEDASSSADDFSEEYDLEEDEDSINTPATESHSADSLKVPVPRSPREDTARAVEVVYVGRPAIVELSPRRKSFSAVPSRRSSRAKSHSHMMPQVVAASPRHNSISTPKPAFLDIDPCARSTPYSEYAARENSQDSPSLTRTPTTVLSRFSKSINMARKKSRSNIKIDASSSPRDSLSLMHSRNGSMMTMSFPQSPVDSNADSDWSPSSAFSTPNSTRSKPTASPQTPATPLSPASLHHTPSKRSLLGGFNIKRRQSHM